MCSRKGWISSLSSAHGKLFYYDYRHGNYEAMKVYFGERDFSIFINCEDLNEVWSQLVVKFVPRKMRKTVKKPL